MRIVYIAHSVGGDIEANLSDLRRIIRIINLTQPDVIPFCSYYADVVSLNDNVIEERERGISNDTAILKAGIVNELWLTGERVSIGMHNDRVLAESLGIPVINKINYF